MDKKRINILSKKDVKISYYIGPGSGGQKKQKTATGVQILHPESGAIGRCSETRSQFQNKKRAFLNLCKTPKMKFWLSKKIFEVKTGKTIEEVVDEMMKPENLKFEIKKDGKWVEDNGREAQQGLYSN